MTGPQTPPATLRQSKTVRVVHAALTSGVVIFGVVGFLVLRPAIGETGLPPVVLGVLLAISLAASGLAVLVMRRRVPRRSTDESADLFWATAATPALLTWAPLEGGALCGIVTYALTGSPFGMVVAGIALLGLLAYSPALLERA